MKTVLNRVQVRQLKCSPTLSTPRIENCTFHVPVLTLTIIGSSTALISVFCEFVVLTGTWEVLLLLSLNCLNFSHKLQALAITKIQISTHQKKALSELYWPITVGRCKLCWYWSHLHFLIQILIERKLKTAGKEPIGLGQPTIIYTAAAIGTLFDVRWLLVAIPENEPFLSKMLIFVDGLLPFFFNSMSCAQDLSTYMWVWNFWLVVPQRV